MEACSKSVLTDRPHKKTKREQDLHTDDNISEEDKESLEDSMVMTEKDGLGEW